MKYSAKFFSDSMPIWKRKKDPLICTLLYRPLSFHLSAICANRSISANSVSYFSIVVALFAGLFFLIGTYECNIVAAILLNFWITLDCVDGNLARSVNKQFFGEFADAISGYILTSVICFTMGLSTYAVGGIIFSSQNLYVIILSSVAAISDPLMRLIYQKFKATLRELQDRGVVINYCDNHQDVNQVSSLLTRLEEVLGFGGILPMLVLIATIFNALDVIVIYCFAYYGGACVVMTIKYILNAIYYEKNLSSK